MSTSQTLLCRYHYDPLDRLAGHAAAGETDTRLFYQKSRLATQIQGALHHSVLQVDDQLLAQQQSSGKAVETTLLATDQQRSVLQSMGGGQRDASAYTAYGHLPMSSGLSSLLGFDGERRDPITGHYLLGNGYRAFNPVLMRFNSPDSLSPFGEGGLNAYAYCQGDPVNYRDPTGRAPYVALLKSALKQHTSRHIKTFGLNRISLHEKVIQKLKNYGPSINPDTDSGLMVSIPSSSGVQGAKKTMTRNMTSSDSSARSVLGTHVSASSHLESTLANGQPKIIGYGKAKRLEIYGDDVLAMMDVDGYKSHVKYNMGALTSHTKVFDMNGITSRQYNKFLKEYSIEMLRHFNGRYGDLVTPSRKKISIETYQIRLRVSSAALRS